MNDFESGFGFDTLVVDLYGHFSVVNSMSSTLLLASASMHTIYTLVDLFLIHFGFDGQRDDFFRMPQTKKLFHL